MTDAQFNDLDRFVAYADKQFELRLLAGCFADGRPIRGPARAVGLSLLWAKCSHPQPAPVGEETKLPQWQRWVGYPTISHDTFGYASNRMNPEQLRGRPVHQPQAQTGQSL